MVSTSAIGGDPSRAARRRRVWLAVAGAGALLVGSAPFAAGFVAARVAERALVARLGVPAAIGSGRCFGGFRFRDLHLGDPARPLARIAQVDVPLAALWGRGVITVSRPELRLVRGGAEDGLDAWWSGRSGRDRPASGAARGGAPRRPDVEIKDGRLRLEQAPAGPAAEVTSFDAFVSGEGAVTVRARGVRAELRLGDRAAGPTVSAAAVDLELRLAAGRRPRLVDARVVDGRAEVLPTLPLTGISGALVPARDDRQGTQVIALDFSGGYAGSRETLWSARGTVELPDGGEPSGTFIVRAEKFALGQIAEVLPRSILEPAAANLDADLRLALEHGHLGFGGHLTVENLSLLHPALASEPLRGLTFGVDVDGAVDWPARRLELTRLHARLRDLAIQLSGRLELSPGVYLFSDGRTLPFVPRLQVELDVPRLKCARLLGSIPAPVVPRLRGFVLDGQFAARVTASIDFAALDALSLDGKVGIDGCVVKAAPEDVTALAGPVSIVQTVEVPPDPETAAAWARRPPPAGTLPELLDFVIGPENEDFVPFDRLSPHLVNALMTTEDAGFFRHRGWAVAEFKTALRRNLEAGRFKLGASSITMQMVKNLLLSREKTLSRKLQELFLVWYVEQVLPKERILELYFNAIEFGPRLYGIGAAFRHYFGKSASDATPLEAAFISSILPSPKKRYVQYCQGALSPAWDRYVRRIMKRMFDRGRLSAEDYEAWKDAPFAFDLNERPGNEKACLEWIKRITEEPESAGAPDDDSP